MADILRDIGHYLTTVGWWMVRWVTLPILAVLVVAWWRGGVERGTHE